MYFSWLARKMRKESEDATLPASVTDVNSLLIWLGKRRKGAAPLFDRERLRVTVNRQFAEGFTKLEDGDEIGLVPNSPTPPATPDLI
ncbi:MAG: MoaD/ThiS family protein [Chromatiaceae bacterium]